MDRPMVSFSVHAHTPGCKFHPGVRGFSANGSEVISVDIVDMFTSVFLNRERLHQLKDVLVAACEKYPITFTIEAGPDAPIPVPDSLAVTYDDPCPDCGGKSFHSDTCFLAKDQEDRRVEA